MKFIQQKIQEEALTVFRLYEASGEWFDLSKKPIERDTFYIDKEESYEKKYFINR